jgi:glycosyltransferase involved in cell wall biosynthesis
MIILNRLVVGGTAMNTLHLIDALKKDYSVVLITGCKETDESEVDDMTNFPQGVEHIRLPSLIRSVNLIKDATAFFRIRQLIRKHKPQLVQTIGAKPGFIGRIAAWLSNVPVIVHAYHGDVFHSYFHPVLSKVVISMERFAASKSTCLTTVSAKQKNELVNVYKIAPAEKIIHIPIGIQVEKFADPDGSLRRSFRQKYFLDNDEIAIGIIGRIAPVKNHLLFLRIVKSINDSQQKKTRFFIIGDGPGLRKNLEDQLQKWGIDFTYFPAAPKKSFLTFTSWIYDIETAANGLDIIVLTSRNEGTPLSIIEAQAAAKPVVTTNAGAVDEVIQQDISGIIVQSPSEEEFVKALLLLINDPAMRQRMGQAGQTFVQNRFQFSRQIAATIGLYKSLISP